MAPIHRLSVTGGRLRALSQTLHPRDDFVATQENWQQYLYRSVSADIWSNSADFHTSLNDTDVSVSISRMEHDDLASQCSFVAPQMQANLQPATCFSRIPCPQASFVPRWNHGRDTQPFDICFAQCSKRLWRGRRKQQLRLLRSSEYSTGIRWSEPFVPRCLVEINRTTIQPRPKLCTVLQPNVSRPVRSAPRSSSSPSSQLRNPVRCRRPLLRGR